MFFGGRLAIAAIFLFAVIIIFSFFKIGIKPNFDKIKILIIPVLLWLAYFISSFYSGNKAESNFDLEVKFSLLALPILFFLEFRNNISMKTIFSWFMAGGIFSSTILYIVAIFKYIQTGVFPFYSDFSIFLHASYFAMYLNFIILGSIYMLFMEGLNKQTLIFSIGLMTSLISIILADSKSGILITLITTSVLLFILLLRKNRKLALVSLAFGTISLALIFGLNQRFRIMTSKLVNFKETLENPTGYAESTAMRIMTWDASIKLIKENPWTGVGNGDLHDQLQKKYKELHYNLPAEKNLNTHNQYLETWLSTGILGFGFLLFLIFYPIFHGIKQRNFLLVSLISIFGLNLVFESMLNTQAGVIFFMFWYCITVVKNMGEPSPDTVAIKN